MKVLIAEDDAVTRRVLEANLRNWGYDVVVCADGAEASAALQREESVHLVILDWMMPIMTGVEICRQIRDSTRKAYTYVILLTGKSERDEVVQGLEAGADDYITKPFDPNELKVRVRAGARIVHLQQDLLAALEKSEFQATHDALTTLWNRAAILERLSSELARSSREGTPVGVIIADIDHFKHINDEHGHLCGDEVLREVARALAALVRPYDVVGRYGGEEFVAVLPGCNTDQATEIAERLRNRFSTNPVRTLQGSLRVTLSFGVASTTDEKKHRDVDPVIQAADEALYEAKRKGRNRVEACGRHLDR